MKGEGFLGDEKQEVKKDRIMWKLRELYDGRRDLLFY